MRSSKSLPLLCSTLLLAVFAAGCQKDAADEAGTTAEAVETPAEAPTDPAPAPAAAEPEKAAVPAVEPPAPVPGTDAAIVEDRTTPTDAAPAFDAKAFAGRFVGGDTALEVTADGMFALDIAGAATQGTWTLQPGGKRITLDPDSKGENDRSLEVVSNDTVKLDGKSLQRQAGG